MAVETHFTCCLLYLRRGTQFSGKTMSSNHQVLKNLLFHEKMTTIGKIANIQSFGVSLLLSYMPATDSTQLEILHSHKHVRHKFSYIINTSVILTLIWDDIEKSINKRAFISNDFWLSSQTITLYQCQKMQPYVQTRRTSYIRALRVQVIYGPSFFYK